MTEPTGIKLLDELDVTYDNIESHPEHAMRRMRYHKSYPALRTLLLEARDALRDVDGAVVGSGTKEWRLREAQRIARAALAKLEGKDG